MERGDGAKRKGRAITESDSLLQRNYLLLAENPTKQSGSGGVTYLCIIRIMKKESPNEYTIEI